MDETELARWVDLLNKIPRSGSPTKSPPKMAGDDVWTVFRGLREVIVQFRRPKGRINPDNIKKLRPLLAFFDPDGGQKAQIEAMFAAVLVVAENPSGDLHPTHQSPVFWQKMLYEESNIQVRLKCRLDTTDETGSKNKTVKEFAELLAVVIKGLVDGAPMKSGSLPVLSPTKTYIDSDVSVPANDVAMINVLIAFDVETLREQYHVYIDGDPDAWYLAIMRAGTNKRPLPDTYITINGGLDDASQYEINGRPVTNTSLVRDFESSVVANYRLPSDDLITEICKLTIQNCRDYFPQPADVASVIANVLNRSWAHYDGHETIQVGAFFNTRVSFSMALPRSWVLEHAKSRRLGDSDRVESPLYIQRYILTEIEYMVYLDNDYLKTCGLPGIISRWLESTKEYDVRRFFNPGNWILR